MFSFMLFALLAIIFGYFATQNTQTISVTFAGQALSNVPLFIIIGVSFLVGLTLSWIISLFDSFASTLKIRGKEHTIKDAKSTIHEMIKRANELEIENAELNKKIKLLMINHYEINSWKNLAVFYTS